MANPQDPGTFDIWITNRLSFRTVVPKSGNTGDFEKWITDRIRFSDYVEAAAAAGETLSVNIGQDQAAYLDAGLRVWPIS